MIINVKNFMNMLHFLHKHNLHKLKKISRRGLWFCFNVHNSTHKDEWEMGRNGKAHELFHVCEWKIHMAL